MDHRIGHGIAKDEVRRSDAWRPIDRYQIVTNRVSLGKTLASSPPLPRQFTRRPYLLADAQVPVRRSNVNRSASYGLAAC